MSLQSNHQDVEFRRLLGQAPEICGDVDWLEGPGFLARSDCWAAAST